MPFSKLEKPFSIFMPILEQGVIALPAGSFIWRINPAKPPRMQESTERISCFVSVQGLGVISALAATTDKEPDTPFVVKVNQMLGGKEPLSGPFRTLALRKWRKLRFYWLHFCLVPIEKLPGELLLATKITELLKTEKETKQMNWDSVELALRNVRP